MGEPVNPLIPVGYDIAWTVVTVLMIALLLVAFISLVRFAPRLKATSALIWSLLIICVPIVGPIAWLAVGRRSGLSSAQATSSE